MIREAGTLPWANVAGLVLSRQTIPNESLFSDVGNWIEPVLFLILRLVGVSGAGSRRRANI